jgi:hypothetical protein
MLVLMGGTVCSAQSPPNSAPEKAAPPLPSIDYDAARDHEMKPHRRTIPHEGVRAGFNQFQLTLVVLARISHQR